MSLTLTRLCHGSPLPSPTHTPRPPTPRQQPAGQTRCFQIFHCNIRYFIHTDTQKFHVIYAELSFFFYVAGCDSINLMTYNLVFENLLSKLIKSPEFLNQEHS